MQWNNLYLIPIVLIGGLLAFGAGRTIVARFLAGVGRLFGGAANKVAATVPVAPDKPAETPYVDPPAPARRSLADRREALAQDFVTNDDQWGSLAATLKYLDDEETRRAELIDAARKRSRSNNVLVGKLEAPASAGPMTQAIQLTEETLATLKAARDSKS